MSKIITSFTEAEDFYLFSVVMYEEVPDTRKRAARSCTNCRRSKTRCYGWEDPPCARCRSFQQKCEFSKPDKSTSGGIVAQNERIKYLEKNIEQLNKTISELTEAKQKSSSPIASGSSVQGNSPHKSLNNGNEGAQSASSSLSDTIVPEKRQRSQTESSLSPAFDQERFQTTPASSVPLENQAAPQSTYLAPFEMLASVTSSSVTISESSKKSFLPAANSPYDPSNKAKFPHAVDKGFISAREGYHLLNTYFDRCHLFSPILDPRECSFDHLCIAAPLLVNAILTVVLRLEARAPYKTIEAVAHEAYSICTSTLLWSSNSTDCVESVCLLSTWSTPNYLLSGHALRLGLDMRLDHTFSRLEEIASFRSKDKSEKKTISEDEERELVRGARLYLQLLNLDSQVSITGNRPIMLGENERISASRCTLLLHNQYSLPSDNKLISDLCLATLKTRINETAGMISGFLALNYARRTATRLDHWYEEWDKNLSHHYPKDSFLRQSLIKELHFARIYLFSSCLRSAGVVGIDYNKQDALELIFLTQQSACVIISLCIQNNAFSHVLQYATPAIHLEIAFTSKLLLKLARLFPDTNPYICEGLIEKIESLLKILTGCVGAQRYLKHINEALNEFLSTERPHASRRGTPIPTSNKEPPLPGVIDLDQNATSETYDSADFSTLLSNLPNDVQSLFSGQGPNLEEQRTSPITGLESIFTPGWANNLGGME